MKNQTISLLNEAFEEVVGQKPTKIVDVDGNPPSEANNYLYSDMVGDFTGRAHFSNYKYDFRLFRESGRWSLELLKK